jgi:hypothetical protein
VDSYTVLRDLARVLRVEIGALTGIGPSHVAAPAIDQQLAAIERALLIGAVGEDVADVRMAVPDLHRAYQAADYDEVLAALPSLIAALDGQDIAWAHAQRRRDAEALVALLEVERAAPQVTRRNAVARDTIRQLLARARGSSGAAVRSLADRAEVTV